MTGVQTCALPISKTRSTHAPEPSPDQCASARRGKFSGVGGHASVLLLTGMGLSPWLGALAGGVAAALLSVAMGYPTMRLRGPYFALTTIAFAEVIRIWFENTDVVFGIQLKGAEGLSVPLVGTSWAKFQFESKVPYYYIILGMLVAVMTITWLMERSRLGVCLKAIRGDPGCGRVARHQPDALHAHRTGDERLPVRQGNAGCSAGSASDDRRSCRE